MNRTKLKNYAPQARRDFIAAVTNRAAYYGLTENQIEPITEQGDVAIIGGRAFPRTVAPKRKRLEDRIARHGFAQVMEAMAYTWFNRLVAIRFMELHGYLDHGYRVLSHPEGKDVPEIVEHAEHVELPGLNTDTIIDLKLDGTKEVELYRLLLIAQCNALHDALPFLFERIDDETELLLPDNLLHSNSLIRTLVSEIDSEDWQEVEIIGWLYQFYISEKKDQVIGKVVKSEDIPAATQLFTPNWIVKYMVQNSLGAQWLATYPDAPLREKMEYYIEPAEQTPEVQARLRAITPDSLNPEELTLLDPACGSGHILVEAYELLKEIYLERGYRVRDIPTLILQKNLFGLEIDDRAAQLAAFTLMMKARADDRRVFGREVQPQVLSFQESKGLNAKQLADAINAPVVLSKRPDSDEFEFMEETNTPLFSKKNLAVKGEIKEGDIATLVALFEEAKTFGSLITVPEELADKLPVISQRVEDVLEHGDLEGQAAARGLKPLVVQASLLAGWYDVVVTNPPYMGSKYQTPILKEFAKDHFPRSKADLFAVSTERFLELAKPTGFAGLMTSFTWMFLKSYESFRELIIESKTLQSLIQPEYHALFETAYVPVCTFVIQNCHMPGFDASFVKLSDFYGAELQPEKTLEAIRNPECGWFYRAKPDEFTKIPGSPITYWVSKRIFELFTELPPLSEVGHACSGLQTGDNDLYLRQWFEVSYATIALWAEDLQSAQTARWLPHRKGGGFQRWYGNFDYVLDWDDNGREIKANSSARPQNTDAWFKPAVTWSHTSSSLFSARFSPAGSTFNVEGPSFFSEDSIFSTGLMCSAPVFYLMQLTNPTLHFLVGSVSSVPAPKTDEGTKRAVRNVVSEAIARTKKDWDSYQRSWDFQVLPILSASSDPMPTLESSYTAWISHNRETIAEMKRLEEENNRLFIDAYGLQDELTPDVPIEQITLTVNPAYRYGGKFSEEEQWTRFCQDTMEELVSYAIGCMMGRYSLDTPGLIYAHSGNEGFDHEIHKIYEKKKTECLSSGSCPSHEACLSNDSYFSSHSCISWFAPDQDGIVPLTDTEWFDDDAAHRLIKFISVAWDAVHLEDNLTFLANNLSPKRNESSRETLRRYLCDSFFKDHLQTYKNRPIYWLFSSGKQRAFQCLVYLHRYNDGTLSRMRTEYVIPLQGKIAARIDQLKADVEKATSTSHSRKLEKERDTFLKQQTELHAFDEKLRHYADQRISLDLDDGVKVNYGKFGDLLAEVKAVCGKA